MTLVSARTSKLVCTIAKPNAILFPSPVHWLFILIIEDLESPLRTYLWYVSYVPRCPFLTLPMKKRFQGSSEKRPLIFSPCRLQWSWPLFRKKELSPFNSCIIEAWGHFYEGRFSDLSNCVKRILLFQVKQVAVTKTGTRMGFFIPISQIGFL